MEMKIGVLHPGAMGASVATAAAAAGNTVLWVSTGRSVATRQRAEHAHLVELRSLTEVAELADLIFSVCPPHAAVDLVESVARTGFSGIFVDANAISPERSRLIGKTIETSGGRFVDGGLIGPPAWHSDTTRLYLCGQGAEDVAGCFRGSPLEALVLDAPMGAASALKMVYAAYTKGTTALLSAILAVAEQEGVLPFLQREWELSQPSLAESSINQVRSNAGKAWRFAGEMHEIADTFASSSLPAEFHLAAAEVYRRLSEFKDVGEPPPIGDIIRSLQRRS